MGERSKTIGEYGERTAENFFSAIGWKDMQKGIDIPCVNAEKHLNPQGNPKETHGIDFVYSYMSPLVSGQLQNVLISSKFKTEKYPSSPTKIFKEFINDLIEGLECFNGSEVKRSIIDGFECSSINDAGVLFWLNNDPSSEGDLISIISGVRIDAQLDSAMYIMDNKHVDFILSLMNFLKANDKFNHSFYYPNTGQNINPQTRLNSGPILPLEYLNSSIIPIKLENKNNMNERCLFLATIDQFEKEDLLRLIGLAKDITTDLVGSVIIAFPDYVEMEHKNIVASAKHQFQQSEFTDTVRIVNFNNPLNIY